jgi:hypothetical protein
LRNKGQVATFWHAHQFDSGDSLAQVTQTPIGHQPISVSDNRQGRHSDLFQLSRHVELFHHAEAMRDDSLVGLPALARDKLEKGSGLLPAAEQQIEKLINESVVRGKGVTGQNGAGNSLEKAALVTSAASLDHKILQPVGKTGGKF